MTVGQKRSGTKNQRRSDIFGGRTLDQHFARFLTSQEPETITDEIPMMEDSLVPGSMAGMDMDFMEQNPEAIFDLITIRSIQDRYGKLEPPRSHRQRRKHETEAVYQNETEFETFVQQFPIDDSIAACFAAENGNLSPKPENKFVSGGKRPQVSTNFSKLKKKFGWKSVEEASLLSEEEIKSRDSKRSKKGGGVFSKRHKWRNLNGNNGKKSVNFSDQSEKSGSDTAVKTDAKVPTTYRDARNATGSDDVFRTDSCSWSDSQITSFSEILSQEMDQTVPVHSKWPSSEVPVHNSITTKSLVSLKESPTGSLDTFGEILYGNTTEIIQKIEDMQPNEVIKLRDHRGNNLLHRAVLIGSPDVIKYILENFPEMTSEMNQENETAIEIAVKYGKYECLKVILDRNQRRRSLGVSLVNRLLNISAQHGQADCLSLILSYTSRDQQSACALPGDARGNTAAHLAAKHGHVHCLEALVAAGYDVTSENLMQQRPLHVAHQSRSHDCFEYLLLLNVCEDLLSLLEKEMLINKRLRGQVPVDRPTLDHIKSCLRRYGDLCSETNQLLMENKLTILQTLNTLKDNLEQFVQHTSLDCAAKRKEARDKLEELRGEIERLEDTFEFSPLAEMDGALSKLMSSLEDETGGNGEVSQNGGTTVAHETSTILSSLIKDIHREFMLENWNTDGVYARHLGQATSSNGTKNNTQAANVRMTYAKTNVTFAKSEITKNVIAEGQNDFNTYSESKKYTNNTTPQYILVENSKHAKNEDSKLTASLSSDTSGNPSEIAQDVEEVLEKKEQLFSSTDTGSRQEVLPNSYHEEEVSSSEARVQGNFISESQTQSNVPYSRKEADDKDEGRDLTDRGTEKMIATERPFTKLLSLDERIDMLIAGEKEKEKVIDGQILASSSESRDSYGDAVESAVSFHTSTFTSITSDTSVTSDWQSKLGLTSLETTSSDDITNDVSTSTASYWWDTGEGRGILENRYDYRVSVPFSNDIKRRIHLNLENDGSSYDELREHRLQSHLRSLQQTRYSSDQYRERITTSTGEIMGGFDPPRTDDKVVVDVNGALRDRKGYKPMPKPRKRGKTKLFTLEDAIATKPLSESEYRERYDRTRTSGQAGHATMRWEEMSITDEEDDQVSWPDYDRIYTTTGRGDSSGSHTPQSYV